MSSTAEEGSSGTEPMINLQSKDGREFLVPRKVGAMSNLVANTFEEEEEEDESNSENTTTTTVMIPLPNVDGDTLSRVVEYCTHYQTYEEMKEIITPFKSTEINDIVQTWYADYVSPERMDQDDLFALVAAANYMDIKPLLDLVCLAVIKRIFGKTKEEMWDIFNIIPPSEEERAEELRRMRQENWRENNGAAAAPDLQSEQSSS